MAKKKRGEKTTSEKYKAYKVSGDKIERNKTCPKCGVGVFLGVHKDRIYCGKCKYTEFTKK